MLFRRGGAMTNNNGETFCDQCDFLGNPSDNPYRWYCLKQPKIDGVGHLSKTYRAKDPYMLCSGINGGACSLFQPKRKQEE